ncbi:hypothetical protein CBS101457_002452 [Exobasidium rhododendri]|nr:hypothetical protein CBS101457_002452 [Exobasidium rhododendri]
MALNSPHPHSLSLTDELAEATNELLDLGESSHRNDQPGYSSWPLPTPSPLNLGGSGGAGVTTISNMLVIGENARLTLIHDDSGDEEVYISDGSKVGGSGNGDKKHRSRTSTTVQSQPEDALDADKHLPSSQLNRLVAPVSNTALPYLHGPSPPRSRSVSETVDSHIWLGKQGGMILATKSRIVSAPKDHYYHDGSHHHTETTPKFFTESFPDARATSEAANIAKEDESLPLPVESPSRSSHGPHLPLTEPAKATLSSVDLSDITVKLHGNGRLEREAEARSKEQEEVALQDELQAIHEGHNDEGDSSSLLSLPATSITNSSGASTRARRRPIRRRSNGSASLATEDIESMDDIPFARDVQIRGFNTVGEKARGFVCYDIRVITVRGTPIGILRRFSSFCQLKQSLVAERPHLANLLPSLPPKRSGLLHKYASNHLEKRRRALQSWLAIVMLDRRWGTTKSLRDWVIGSSDE